MEGRGEVDTCIKGKRGGVRLTHVFKAEGRGRGEG